MKEKIYSIKNIDNDNNDMKIIDDDNVNILPLPVEKKIWRVIIALYYVKVYLSMLIILK